MKQTVGIFWNILLASLLCMVAYLALYAIWGAFLNEVENETIRLILVSACTSVAYAAILFYLVRIRRGVGRDELLYDYKNTQYTTLRADLPLILLREKPYLIMIASVILACLLINKVNTQVLGNTNTPLTFPFATMCIFSSCFPSHLDFIGYLFGMLVIAVCYLLFSALYRKKQYEIWLKQEEHR